MELLKRILWLFAIITITLNAKAQTYSVGQMNAAVEVNPMGNITAQIPIFCPPGRSGVQPTMALTYNSGAGEGLLGKGAGLSGMSVISRVGSNFHLNGKQEGILFTADDQFDLDGNRLIWVGGNQPGTNGSIYRTESDQFVRVIFEGDYFTVEFKDGGLAFYGTGGNSSLVPSGSSVASAYYLYRRYDVDGNYIEYNYTMPGGRILLDEIKYTGFDCSLNGFRSCSTYPTSAPFNKIKFTYKASTKSNTVWVKGYSLTIDQLLEKVQVYQAATVVRTYDLVYETNNLHDYVKEIKETNGNTESLQPVTFNWSDGPSYNLQTFSMLLDPNALEDKSENALTYTGDFNGDGKTDVLTIQGMLDPTHGKWLSSLNYYKITTYQNQFPAISAINTGHLLQTTTNPGLSVGNITNVSVADINQDGLDDIFFQVTYPFYFTSGKMNYSVQYHAMVAYIDEQGKLQFTLKDHFFIENDKENAEPQYDFFGSSSAMDDITITPYLADCDGDGLLDLIEFSQVHASYSMFNELYVTYGKARQTRFLVNYTPVGYAMYGTHILDFNGNGKADIGFVYYGSTTIVELTGGIGFTGIADIGVVRGQDRKGIQTGDFNGDGKTDFVYYTDRWIVGYSRGDGNLNEHDATTEWGIDNMTPEDFDGAETDNNKAFLLHIGDFNGDGKSDIAARHFHPYGGTCGGPTNYLNLFYSTGYGFTLVPSVPIPTTGNIGDVLDYSYTMLGDFNGDGKTDMFSRQHSTPTVVYQSVFKYAIQYFPDRHKILSNIYTDINTKHEFVSKPLSLSSQYKKESGLKIDQAASITPKMSVVESYTYSISGSNVSKQTKYYYKNCLFNRHGRGVMGFTSTAIVQQHTNANKQTTIISENEQDPEHLYKLLPKRVKTYKSSSVFGNFVVGTDLLSEKEVINVSIPTVPGISKAIHFQYVSRTTEKNYLTQIQTVNCTDYDLNGNLVFTRSSVSPVGNFSFSDYITTTNNEFEKKASWLPSVLKRTQTTQIRYNSGVRQDPYTTQTDFTNNPQNKTIRVQQFINNNDLYLSSTVFYDQYGNVEIKKVDYVANVTGSPITVETNTYSSDGRFLLSSKNALNQTTTYSTDPVYGNLLTVTGANGLVSQKEYDAWGRLTKTILPTGVEELTTMSWNTTALPTFVTNVTPYYYIQTSNSTGEIGRVYFDKAARKMATWQKTFGNKNVYSDVKYDDDGLVIFESNAYTSADDKIYTESIYDDMNRVFKKKLNNQLAVTLTYDKTTVTETYPSVIPSGKVKTSTANSTGQVVKISENGMEVLYTYGSHSLPLTINADGSITTFKYNDALQQTQLCDPNAGCVDYEYNALGQLVKQTDANGSAYEMEYDLLGRVVRKFGGNDEEYTYVFNGAIGQGNLNQIASEELKKGGVTTHTLTHNYGPKGELIRIDEEAPGVFTKREITYTYDQWFRVSIVTYPNLKIGYEYDNLNNLKKVILLEKDGVASGNTIWYKKEELADGRMKNFEYGNGFKYTNMYDQNLNLLSTLCRLDQVNNILTESAIFYNYNFDLLTGNLNWREDLIAGPVYGIGKESFKYDNFDRLTQVEQLNRPANVDFMGPYIYHVSSTSRLNIGYASNGNITGKYDAGTYTYNPNKPHALQTNDYRVVDLTPRITPAHFAEEQHITYTAFNKIATLTQAGTIGSDIPVSIDFEYGFSQQRIKMEITENNIVTNTTYYIGSASMELVNNDEVTYLYAEGVPFAMHRLSDNKIYYLHCDYQGSLLAISNEAGVVVEHRRYDAWGRPRNISDFEYQLPNPFGGSNSSYTLRGYTFHEHLDMVGLINMNGRMYDPVLGRILSPDNYVQDATNTQNFNRYSYCLNNPLKYTDPDGNFITWNFGQNGFSLGVNFTPIGIPLGGG